MSYSLRIILAFMFLVAAACGAPQVYAQAASGHAVTDGSASRSDSTTATVASASQGEEPYRLKRGDNEFGGWFGIGFKATTIFGGLREEEARDRKFAVAAFRYGRTLAANRRMALQYTLDAVPLAVASGNIVETTTVVTPTGSVTTFRRESTYGAGLTPLGLQLDFANGSRVHPFIHINGGFLIFTKSVPLPDAGKFAYVGETGAGLRIFTSERRALSLGFRFHHISNGDRMGANRGLNQFLLAVGFSIFK
ncbi:MAG TPA: acyloxyacyl hydrolase [Pyrinomonadaceae bacterium]|jgi:hypothetical protein|nr:acyloxyacyl hydrolase [Pyrinomonadaceae bacterium]